MQLTAFKAVFGKQPSNGRALSTPLRSQNQTESRDTFLEPLLCCRTWVILKQLVCWQGLFEEDVPAVTKLWNQAVGGQAQEAESGRQTADVALTGHAELLCLLLVEQPGKVE